MRVHVGDSLHEDVAGARAAGIRPVLVERDAERGPARGSTVVSSLAELPPCLTKWNTCPCHRPPSTPTPARPRRCPSCPRASSPRAGSRRGSRGRRRSRWSRASRVAIFGSSLIAGVRRASERDYDAGGVTIVATSSRTLPSSARRCSSPAWSASRGPWQFGLRATPLLAAPRLGGRWPTSAYCRHRRDLTQRSPIETRTIFRRARASTHRRSALLAVAILVTSGAGGRGVLLPRLLLRRAAPDGAVVGARSSRASSSARSTSPPRRRCSSSPLACFGLRPVPPALEDGVAVPVHRPARDQQLRSRSASRRTGAGRSRC